MNNLLIDPSRDSNLTCSYVDPHPFAVGFKHFEKGSCPCGQGDDVVKINCF